MIRQRKPNVGSSKNLARATFRKMPEAGLKIAQKGLKNTFFCQNFAEAPSLAGVFWILEGSKPPPTRMYGGNYNKNSGFEYRN